MSVTSSKGDRRLSSRLPITRNITSSTTKTTPTRSTRSGAPSPSSPLTAMAGSARNSTSRPRRRGGWPIRRSTCGGRGNPVAAAPRRSGSCMQRSALHLPCPENGHARSDSRAGAAPRRGRICLAGASCHAPSQGAARPKRKPTRRRFQARISANGSRSVVSSPRPEKSVMPIASSTLKSTLECGCPPPSM